MTQRELMEEGIDVERGQERVAEILAASQKMPDAHLYENVAKPARKKRSDAGKPKQKPQEKAAVLTTDRARELDSRVRDLIRAREGLQKAQELADSAFERYEQLMHELQGI